MLGVLPGTSHMGTLCLALSRISHFRGKAGVSTEHAVCTKNSGPVSRSCQSGGGGGNPVDIEFTDTIRRVGLSLRAADSLLC